MGHMGPLARLIIRMRSINRVTALVPRVVAKVGIAGQGVGERESDQIKEIPSLNQIFYAQNICFGKAKDMLSYKFLCENLRPGPGIIPKGE